VLKVDKIAKTPLNLVVVIDRSETMKANIDIVGGGIVGLVDSLDLNGWDTKTSVIGFKDFDSELLISSFVSADNVERTMRDWPIEGGGDIQGGGLSALYEAFKHLKRYGTDAPERAKGKNVILYVSNSPAFYAEDPSDFNVEEMYRDIEGVGLGDVSFLYAVPSVAFGDNLPKPSEQMQQLVGFLGKGKALAYPLTKDILKGLSYEFVRMTQTQPYSCRVTDARLVSLPGQGKSLDLKVVGFEGVIAKGDAVQFIHEQSEAIRKFQLSLTRCCKIDPLDKACSYEQVSRLGLEFFVQ
jgi:hypothetical protein